MGGLCAPSFSTPGASRYGRTPGWMVLYPAVVRPLGTDNLVLAQLKPPDIKRVVWGGGLCS